MSETQVADPRVPAERAPRRREQTVSAPARGLTIGIDARAAAEVTAGRGRVVRELLRALAAREEPHTYRCYSRSRWEEPLDQRFEWVVCGGRDGVWHARIAADVNRECDVFLSTNSYLTVPLLRVPVVATVYDLVAFDRALLPNPVSAVVERLTLRPAAYRAATLWCISRTTANALVNHLPSAGHKVQVVPLAATSELETRSDDNPRELPEPGFVLAVGTLEPRKNLPRLIAAYSSLPPELQEAHPLVIAGERGWRTRRTLEAIRSLGPRCITLGYVSDAELGELYRRCAVFCYPSLAEGFGLPVLEAMAAGAAVITSDASSLPEVGGEAAEYVHPRSTTSIAAALERTLGSAERRRELGALALERAQQFSWSQTGAAVLGLLESAAARQQINER